MMLLWPAKWGVVMACEDLGPKSVAICGAGLVGCLLGVYLRKHGFPVTIFESRPDPRAKEEVC